MDDVQQTQGSIERGCPGIAPLWAVMVVTWLASFGGGIGWNGVFFITEDALGFTKRDNLLLGAALGLIYAVCAASAGRIMRKLIASGWSLRGLLVMVLAGTALISAVPLFAKSTWSIWVFGAGYQSLIGLLWPIVEAYLSGGRRGRRLLGATGKFNLVWASALVVAMVLMAPVIDTAPFQVFGWLGIGQVICVVLVLAYFPKQPAPAGHAEEVLEQESYGIERARSLLRGFRILLMSSYVLHAALTPILPHLLSQLGVPIEKATLTASAWLISRFLMFGLLERWHGWHGRWRTAIWSGSLMVLGVVLCVSAPSLPWMFVGLTALGAGVGAVYAAALYYAMESGSAEVDAGGWHEAMIGIGYAIGPMAALAIGSIMGAL